MVRARAGPAGAAAGRDPARQRLRLLGGAGLRAAEHGAPAAGEPARGLRGGHHVRDEQRVRVRLPPRQHGADRRAARAAAAPLRHRRRGRLRAHRRGADAADHLRAAERGPLDLPALQRAGAAARARRALHGRGADALRAPDGGGHRGARARARDREHLLGGELPADALHGGGAQGADHLPARPRLRGERRPGGDRRRVHGPADGGAALVRRPAPGRRGQGGRADPAGVGHVRDDHPAELLPALREAGRHDRHGGDGRRGVPRDLHARRRGDADAPADDPRGPSGLRLPLAAGEVQGGDRRGGGAPRGGAAAARRHGLDRGLGAALGPAAAARRRSRGAEREAAPPRGGDRGARGTARRGHDRDEHGRPRGPTSSSAKASRGSAGCTSSGPSGTSRGASTTSCAAARAARATRGRRASSSRSRTTSCGASRRTGCPG